MKFKNIYKSVYTVLLIAVTMFSCNDILKEEPFDFIGPEEVGDSDESIDLWVTGVYSYFLDDMFRWGNFPKVLDIDCDYVTGPDWAFTSLGSGNFQADDVAGYIWTTGYTMINRINLAKKYINQMTACTPRYQQNALGELAFLKAHAYFLLTRAYGEIILFDELPGNEEEYHQPRQSIPTVYAEIIRLLEEAKELLYKNTDTGFTAGHVSAGTAAGLLAKVYATMASGALNNGEQLTIQTGAAYDFDGNGDMINTNPSRRTFTKNKVEGYDFDATECYTKAAQYAKAVMDGEYGRYELLPYADLWKRSSYTQGEHMFTIQGVTGDDKYITQTHMWYAGTRNSAGNIVNGLWVGNRYHWYTLFSSDDRRIKEGVMHRMVWQTQANNNEGMYYPNTPEYQLMAEGGIDANGNTIDPVAPYNDGLNYYTLVNFQCLAFTNKYSDVTDQTQGNTDAGWTFLRYADVVLIYAEAMAELSAGVSAEAIAALNDIRRRSEATLAVTTGDGAITTKTELRSAIFEERAKELTLEGHRRWDLIRWGVYLDAMNAIGGYDECSNNKNRETKHLLFPIPEDEVITNKNIATNNPGWS